MRPERQEVGPLADHRKRRAPEHLDRRLAAKARQIELHALREARQVDDYEHRAFAVAAQEREDLFVLGNRNSMSPEPRTSFSLRSAMRRLVHHNSDDELAYAPAR